MESTQTSAAHALLERVGVERLDTAFILGSGWSSAADDLGEELGRCPLGELPGFRAPVVAGHGGVVRAVRTGSGRIAGVLTGRTHFYEDRDVMAVTHGVRTLAAAGVERLVLTNGCGSLRPDWGPGQVVLLRDHINLTGATPLRGPEFIDMSTAYSSALREVARSVDAELPEGVYVQFAGPQYETPAEVRMAGVLGGDLVGMSTTLETIAARAAGVEVLGISLVTNLAAGVGEAPLDHAEVLAAGKAAAPRLRELLTGIAEVL